MSTYCRNGTPMTRRAVALLAGMLLLVGLAFTVPTGAALADTSTPVPHAGGLTKAYQNEQSMLAAQATNLTNAGSAAAKVQDLISQANARGVDTSALASALAAFQSQLAAAQSVHAAAAGVLSAHNGFDGSGSVTNAAAASQTVTSAGQSLNDARNDLVQAVHDLQAAVKAWQDATKGKLQDQALAKTYKNEQDWLTRQQANLGKANGAITRIQDLIGKAQAKGLDTSDLASAFATFQSQVAAAQASNNSAASALSAHNGFDAGGGVTDAAAASQTVKDANQALQAGATLLTQATSDLQAAVGAWEQANRGKLLDQDLQKAYKDDQDWFSLQTDNLKTADDAVAMVQDLISGAQSRGRDTSALQAALTAYQSRLATAQAAHDKASGILSSHNGFDAGGSVTDASAAGQTVQGANQALLDAHNVLVQAVTDLHLAVETWRSQNEPSATPASSANSF